ncbi:hypothetical protein STCU_08292 [Strigomonas culicis]|uniref:Uncharacterized protein n=2 Tax=Strigomonas culicis TaxID=28005 RepID=S9TZY7_9TRYP|nr:hypothetical protein STCU_08292 [Strigomonas culicis]|eukprot:EPY22218.1 hypothetical protein STCU_08292 [Strigomonas culicis]
MKRISFLVNAGATSRWSSYATFARLCSSKPLDGAKTEKESAEVAVQKQSSTEKKADYHFPTEDLLRAVKSGDFGKVQSHATELVQNKWRDEYSVPTACVVIFLVFWYWWAWTRRSIRRKCDAMRATIQEEADQTVERVGNLVKEWKKNMSKANEQMKKIIDKNSELTKDIDRMTTALRSCSIRPTPNNVIVAPAVEIPKTIVEPQRRIIATETSRPAPPAPVSAVTTAPAADDAQEESNEADEE